MVVFVAILWFGIWNGEERVDIRMIPDGRTHSGVSFIFTLLVAFAAGMLTWFLISFSREIGLRRTVRRFRKDNDRLRDELKTLRNLPMEDLDAGEDLIDSEQPLSQ
jgi:hypothetical protein